MDELLRNLALVEETLRALDVQQHALFKALRGMVRLHDEFHAGDEQAEVAEVVAARALLLEERK